MEDEPGFGGFPKKETASCMVDRGSTISHSLLMGELTWPLGT